LNSVIRRKYLLKSALSDTAGTRISLLFSR
jgi:hypothetical protein